jgi:hypothetical protein
MDCEWVWETSPTGSCLLFEIVQTGKMILTQQNVDAEAIMESSIGCCSENSTNKFALAATCFAEESRDCFLTESIPSHDRDGVEKEDGSRQIDAHFEDYSSHDNDSDSSPCCTVELNGNWLVKQTNTKHNIAEFLFSFFWLGFTEWFVGLS